MPGPLIQLETQGIETQLLFNPTLLATLRAPRFASLRGALDPGIQDDFLTVASTISVKLSHH